MFMNKMAKLQKALCAVLFASVVVNSRCSLKLHVSHIKPFSEGFTYEFAPFEINVQSSVFSPTLVATLQGQGRLWLRHELMQMPE